MGMLAMVFVASLLGGFVQGVAGFGALVVVMIVLPYFMPLKLATALAGLGTLPTNFVMSCKYRQKIRYKTVIIPLAFYFLSMTIFVHLAAAINLESLKPVFGLFMMGLSVYFSYFSSKIHVQNNLRNAILCMVVAGFTASFFGISGPVFVLYYVSVLADKEQYIGTMAFIFLLAELFGGLVRYLNGFFSLSDFPVVLMELSGMLLGSQIGNRLVSRIDGAKLKKIVYGMLAISGAMTFVKGIL